jgi:phosphoribosylglycinamide formyltransferase 1
MNGRGRSGCPHASPTINCGVRSLVSARLAVFASGAGSNFEALAQAAARGELGGDVVALFCDQPGAGALERARRLGIEALVLESPRHRTRLDDEAPWLEGLRARQVDVVLLAGFMRRLHATLLEPFAGRVLNIHPSLLPAFPGLDAIGQAFRAGVPVTGCTVHLVDAALDSGPILAQSQVARRPGETQAELEARVHEAEHALYPATVRRFLTEPWYLDGARVRFGEGGTRLAFGAASGRGVAGTRVGADHG